MKEVRENVHLFTTAYMHAFSSTDLTGSPTYSLDLILFRVMTVLIRSCTVLSKRYKYWLKGGLLDLMFDLVCQGLSLKD